MDDTQNERRRAILYCRVSTDDQAKDDKTSLDTQLKANRAYADKQGFVVVGEFKDDFTGTVELSQRPEGSKAYAMLKNGEADVLIVRRMNRLVRPKEEGDEVHLGVLALSLRKIGCEIHTVDDGKIDTRGFGLLMAIYKAGQAGNDYRGQLEIMHDGKVDGVSSKGKSYMGGVLPYGFGYNLKTKTLVVNESEAVTVRYIFNRYVTDGWTHYRIAKDLTESDTPTPGASRKLHNNKYKFWRADTIGSILRNETYAGTWRFGKSGKSVIAVQVPQIVDPVLFGMAQQRLAYNKAMSPRNVKHDYLMRGRIKCGCGFGFSGTNKDGRFFYYRCLSSQVPNGKCGEKRLGQEIVDGLAWKFVRRLMENRALFVAMLQEARKNDVEQAQPKVDRLESIDGLIAEVNEQIESFVASIGRLKNTKATEKARQALENQLQAATVQIENLTAKRKELQDEITNSVPLSDGDVEETVREYDNTPTEDWEHATFERKRYWVDRLDIRMTVENGTIHIAGRHPIKSASVRLIGSYGSSMLGYTGTMSEPHLNTRLILDDAGRQIIRTAALWRGQVNATSRFIEFSATYRLDQITQGFFAKVQQGAENRAS